MLLLIRQNYKPSEYIYDKIVIMSHILLFFHKYYYFFVAGQYSQVIQPYQGFIILSQDTLFNSYKCLINRIIHDCCDKIIKRNIS